MHNFCGLVTKTVNTQNFQRLTMEQNFQHTYAFTGNLCAGDVFEEGLTHFIRHFLFCQLTFSFSDRADFRNTVNTGWHSINEAEVLR